MSTTIAIPAQRAIAGNCDGQDRGIFVVELRYHRRGDVVGQPVEHRGDTVAHVLSGGVNVAIQIERGDDEGSALSGNGTKLLNAFDGVDHLFDGPRNHRFDFLGRSSR